MSWLDELLVGEMGATGATGSIIYTGTAAPSSGVGRDGDFYLQLPSRAFSRRDVDTWVYLSTLGTNGATGATGPTGATGATGPAGSGGGVQIAQDLGGTTGAPIVIGIQTIPVNTAGALPGMFLKYLEPDAEPALVLSDIDWLAGYPIEYPDGFTAGQVLQWSDDLGGVWTPTAGGVGDTGPTGPTGPTGATGAFTGLLSDDLDCNGFAVTNFANVRTTGIALTAGAANVLSYEFTGLATSSTFLIDMGVQVEVWATGSLTSAGTVSTEVDVLVTTSAAGTATVTLQALEVFDYTRLKSGWEPTFSLTASGASFILRGSAPTAAKANAELNWKRITQVTA